MDRSLYCPANHGRSLACTCTSVDIRGCRSSSPASLVPLALVATVLNATGHTPACTARTGSSPATAPAVRHVCTSRNTEEAVMKRSISSRSICGADESGPERKKSRLRGLSRLPSGDLLRSGFQTCAPGARSDHQRDATPGPTPDSVAKSLALRKPNLSVSSPTSYQREAPGRPGPNLGALVKQRLGRHLPRLTSIVQ
jgi:hypothetical protein